MILTLRERGQKFHIPNVLGVFIRFCPSILKTSLLLSHDFDSQSKNDVVDQSYRQGDQHSENNPEKIVKHLSISVNTN